MKPINKEYRTLEMDLTGCFEKRGIQVKIITVEEAATKYTIRVNRKTPRERTEDKICEILKKMPNKPIKGLDLFIKIDMINMEEFLEIMEKLEKAGDVFKPEKGFYQRI